VLQPVGASVRVSFYSSACESLAKKHGVLQSLLHACPKARTGTYNVKTARSALTVISAHCGKHASIAVLTIRFRCQAIC
jgi:hypothetical protein